MVSEKRRFFQARPSDGAGVASGRGEEAGGGEKSPSSEQLLFVEEEDGGDEPDLGELGGKTNALEKMGETGLNGQGKGEAERYGKVGSDGCGAGIGFGAFTRQIEEVLGQLPLGEKKTLYNRYRAQERAVELAVNDVINRTVVGEEVGGADGGGAGKIKVVEDVSKKRQFEEQEQDLIRRIGAEIQKSQEEEARKSWSRFLGSVNVQAWATRPTTRPLQYLQKLDLLSLNSNSKLGNVKGKLKQVALVRVFSYPDTKGQNGREIGRLPEDLNRILAPLVDLNMISLRTTVMLTTSSRLSIGDSFYIQVDVYLTDKAFVPSGATLTGTIDLGGVKKQKTVSSLFNHLAETEEESALRARQSSLARLFDRLGILPLTSDDEAEGSDNSSATNPIVIDSDDLTTSDNANGGENMTQVNLDQLKQIYQANQSSSLLTNLPNTTRPPRSNFGLTLRPYQKHGLSWMLSREKEIDALQDLSKDTGDDVEDEHTKQKGGHDYIMSTQTKHVIEEEGKGVFNPLWSRYKWPKDTSVNPSTSPTPTDLKNYFYANLYNGELSLEKPIVRSLVKGGILADEMGLGKTISTLALINSVPYDLVFEQNKTVEDERNYASKTTLIIVPMSLLTQWKQEFDNSNNNTNHKCIIYYGELTSSDLAPKLCNKKKNVPVVVLTTYGTVLNEYTRISGKNKLEGKLPSIGLYSVKFFRVVLDEGHNIRNRMAKTSKAIYELSLNRKWVLTGTPIINRLDDLYSIVKFLELDPWSNFSYWKTFITVPFEQRKISQSMHVIKSIMEPISIRRTKQMKQENGEPLVKLPPKRVIVDNIKFSERENKIYSLFKTRASLSFKESLKKGELLRRYSQILTHILRLRQICCHTDLVGTASDMEADYMEGVSLNQDDEDLDSVDKLVNDDSLDKNTLNKTELNKLLYSLYDKIDLKDSECSICTQAPIPFGDLAITSCGHLFCLTCILSHIEFQENLKQDLLCPNCRSEISQYKLFKIRMKETRKKEIRFYTKKDVDDPSSKYHFQLFHYDPERVSSKIQALLRHLHDLKLNHQNEQVVVFSQFSSYLDIIENQIKLQGGTDFVVYKFDGRLSSVERLNIIESFNVKKGNADSISVLLLSLKAGGVGLNLTSASRAFMMDPWWSPSVEDQAIDRIHRIGQQQDVQVIRFIIENSIEEKILKIQERKKQIGEAVAVEEEERRKRRIEEIQMLFEE